MKTEIILGIIAGFLSYLIYLGYDITPLVFMGGLGYALFFITKKKGRVSPGGTGR